MDEVLQLVFIMVIIISRYIWSGLVQVFHKDIDILKIIVFVKNIDVLFGKTIVGRPRRLF